MVKGTLMDILQTILSHWINALTVLLVLGGLIFFHELGHFLMARMLGIGVWTFSLGFGPRILSFHKGKTEYRLSLIPLGGYVSLAGESEEEKPEKIDQPDPFLPKEKFMLRPAWHRLLVVVAGPIANIILAFFIYWGVLWTQGNTFLIPQIGTIAQDSPAEHAGLLPQDIITRINGHIIHQWEDIAQNIAENNGQKVILTIDRNNQIFNIQLTPESKTRKNIFGEEEQAWLIGITSSGATTTTPLNIFHAATAGIKKTWSAISFTFESIIKLFQNVVPLDNIGGPILIAQVVGQQANAGLLPVLLLAALISINLAILNLLPIPILDGGHIVFLLIEMIFQRPVSIFIKTLSMRIGLILLLGIMIFATWNDVMRLLS